MLKFRYQFEMYTWFQFGNGEMVDDFNYYGELGWRVFEIREVGHGNTLQYCVIYEAPYQE